LLADVVAPSAYGRAYGFERAVDNLGAIVGLLLALGLVASLGVKWAIGLSVIPGLLAALAITYPIRKTPRTHRCDRQPIRLQLRPVMHGRLGRLIAGIVVLGHQREHAEDEAAVGCGGVDDGRRLAHGVLSISVAARCGRHPVRGAAIPVRA
jgi:MFS family permease